MTILAHLLMKMYESFSETNLGVELLGQGHIKLYYLNNLRFMPLI